MLYAHGAQAPTLVWNSLSNATKNKLLQEVANSSMLNVSHSLNFHTHDCVDALTVLFTSTTALSSPLPVSFLYRLRVSLSVKKIAQHWRRYQHFQTIALLRFLYSWSRFSYLNSFKHDVHFFSLGNSFSYVERLEVERRKVRVWKRFSRATLIVSSSNCNCVCMARDFFWILVCAIRSSDQFFLVTAAVNSLDSSHD